MKFRIAVMLVFCMGALGIARADQTKTDVQDRLQSSTTTIQQIIDAPDKGIPDEVLKARSVSPSYPA